MWQSTRTQACALSHMHTRVHTTLLSHSRDRSPRATPQSPVLLALRGAATAAPSASRRAAALGPSGLIAGSPACDSDTVGR